MRAITAACLVCLAACGGGGTTGDAGTDAGTMHDAAGDLSADADAGPDAASLDGGPTDAGVDADVDAACLHADRDGDGHTALACGGDDCDDGDANRFPGNPEVCDSTGHDEDCDPSTLGPDHDGRRKDEFAGRSAGVDIIPVSPRHAKYEGPHGVWSTTAEGPTGVRP